MSQPRLSEGIRRAYQAMTDSFHGNLTIPRITVLRCLIQGGTIYQRQIVKATGIDRSTVSAMLGRMATDGLVVNVQLATDKRAMMVSITPRGRAILLKADGALAQAEMQMMKRIAPADRAPFNRAIQALAAESP